MKCRRVISERHRYWNIKVGATSWCFSGVTTLFLTLCLVPLRAESGATAVPTLERVDSWIKGFFSRNFDTLLRVTGSGCAAGQGTAFVRGGVPYRRFASHEIRRR